MSRGSASPWVVRFLTGVRPGGHVLDIACGGGRHVALARLNGLRVTGIDRDVSAAATAFSGDGEVRLVSHDLEDGQPVPFGPPAFDGVIVTNYLWRPILADIVAAVAPGGVLVYETFRLGNERFGKPSNPAFLLRPGELIEAVRGKLHVIAYEEALLKSPDRVVQRIAALGMAHPWVGMPPATDTKLATNPPT